MIEMYAGTRFYTAINYTLLQYPTTLTSYGPFQSSTPPVYLSLPADLSLVDPAWKGCLPEEYGALDPPRALSTASALVSQDLGPRPSQSASPGSRIAPAYVPATPTPVPNDPGKTSPQLPYPVPEQPDPSTVSDVKQTADPSEPKPPDLGIARPQAADPSEHASPFSGPIINTAPLSAIIQNLPNDGMDAHRPVDAETYQGVTPGQSPADLTSPTPSIAGHQNKEVEGDDQNQGAQGEDIRSLYATTGPILIAGQPVVRAPGGGLVIGSSTVPPGAQVTISSHTVLAGFSSVLIDGRTYALSKSAGVTLQQPPSPSASPLLIAGQSVVRDPSGGLRIGDSTIASGSQNTFSDHVISAGISSILIDGSTYALSKSAGAILQQARVPSASPVLIAGQSVVGDLSGNLVVGSSTIASGSQMTLSGHVISAGSSLVVIDGSTYALPKSIGTVDQRPDKPQAITLADGAIVSAGGTRAIMSGTTYSIASDGEDLIANGRTIPFPTKQGTVFTIAGNAFTAAPTGFVIAAGETVALDGSAVTIGATVVSLGPSGLQIGTSTVPLDFAQETAEAGLGGLIMSGFGGGGAPKTTSGSENDNVAAFTGGSSRLVNGGLSTVLCIVGVGIGMAAFAL